MIKTLVQHAIAPAIAIAFAAVSSAQAQAPVQFGLVSKLPFSWPLFIAEAKGMFKEGFKPDYSVVGQSSKVVQGIAGGTFAMGHAGIPEAIRATEQGGPVKIIAAEMAVPPYNWNARKGIEKVEDLKGKKVMLGGTKDITYIYLKAIADKHRMQMTDFEFLYAGSTNNRFAALVSGAVDATILGQPFDFTAEAQGFKSVALQKTYTPESAFTVYAVNTDWAAKNRALVVGFLKGFLQGATFLYDQANRAESIDILVKASNGKPEDIAKTYDFYVNELQPFRRDAALTDGAMTDVLKSLVFLGDFKEPTPPGAKFYDDSFLKAARAGS